jgi:hypothetical protein
VPARRLDPPADREAIGRLAGMAAYRAHGGQWFAADGRPLGTIDPHEALKILIQHEEAREADRPDQSERSIKADRAGQVYAQEAHRAPR